MIKHYFQRLFTEEFIQTEDILNCIPKSVSEQQNDELLKPISEEEVKAAFFNMYSDKAPGPDDMTPAFYQKNWIVVGKILWSWLKKVLKAIISDTQSAFLPGRLISDNIMIFFKVMHYLKRKKFGKEGYMAIKLDMSKAYDRIEWRADREDASKVMELLSSYEKASGQRELQISEADSSSKYLGLPNILGRNKSVIFGYFRNKVKNSIKSWNEKKIFKPAKEILIKTVAQTLPSYAMSIFLLPIEIIRNIEKDMARFFWTSNQKSKSKINWMAWERMTKHKHADSLVAQLFKAKYFVNTNFMEAKLGSSPSFILRSICEARSVIYAGSSWRIGNGMNIQILNQAWLNRSENPYVSTVSPSLVNQKVASLLIKDSKDWDLDILEDIFDTGDKQAILNTVVEHDLERDVLYWKLEHTWVYKSGVPIDYCSNKGEHGVQISKRSSGRSYGVSKLHLRC
ncbi:hypothetical protein AgCh_031202 [Apium graveolens]